MHKVLMTYPAWATHIRFLDLTLCLHYVWDQVRADYGLKGSVGTPGWQSTMRQYLKQDRQEAASSLTQLKRTTFGWQPPAYTGLFT